MKVLIVDTFSAKAMDELKAAGIEVIYDTKMKGDLLTEGLKANKPEVLVVRSTKVQVPQLDAGAPELKMVVRAGSGYDTIDTAAAKERNVAVCNTPGMNATAVAELVFGFILTSDRYLHENIQLFREGKWAKGKYAKCHGIKGSTLGLIGFGNIGKLVCDRARAFEMNIIAYDPFIPAATMEAAGAKVTSDIYEIAANCDFITIHVPGGEKTKGMVNDAFLSKMRPGSVIINTSRATIIDEPALIKHVTERGIRACVDVMSNEPAEKEGEFKHPFGEVPGILVSHHIGASTVQAESAIGEEALRVVLSFAQKGEILHRVN
ncbi:putative phosphoglycerate dehydrogenase [Monocercomonoides exilis]|uniref:putative phosphoglycerate dehydrogenase n=1 Tax=Monocercomonoides exilis TaxID=2049356 RepID=UPI003559F6F6|nr:putative phosphoglycerate dehydrogenase [Monocercomonoides exilis]|eukprot:MONOS_5302.1-p1 / transcript=MONOS_5302.1 / gene=MONOS_5302 / organism=Monocercomonoides_exilis_PA203 / gene_product=putative phosphoglycerate dehydrogenase / transcript_product=putative phosphoglycerate dehydrogenase / location=Mono_scaffold00153:1531-2490(-) / protein_length=319 / sequence_SO=supercontig / SO=protein_coding / is_pseudo=false